MTYLSIFCWGGSLMKAAHKRAKAQEVVILGGWLKV